MRIDHIAIWTPDLEILRSFYQHYFKAKAGPVYHNKNNKFYSYFLSFEQGARLEIMQQAGIPSNKNDQQLQYLGLIHFAISVGSVDQVDALTHQLKTDGYEVIGQPRRTGDGYYESIVLDPDGNRVEIMA